MRVEIIGINSSGDGFGFFNGKKVFVKKSAVGDVIEFAILKENKDFILGKILKIIAKSPSRIDNLLCPNYDECGGCNLLHLAEKNYYDYKETIIKNTLERAGYNYDKGIKIVKIGENSRRRVAFQVKNNRLGFFERNTNHLKEIANCPLVAKEINAIIDDLKQLIKKVNILEIAITAYSNGLEVLLTLKKDITLTENEILKDFAENNKNVILLSYRVGNDDYFLFYTKSTPILQLADGISIETSPNIFIQATDEGQKAITNVVMEGLKGCKNILDLYCGIGTYTFPLASYGKVHSVEGLQSMIDILNKNIKTNGLVGKITSECRNLVNSPLLKNELEKYDGIVINPPRNGAKAQCELIAKSRVKRVVMVSCNPQTFAVDVGELRAGGYKLLDVVGVDQFYRTQHLEVVGVFEKDFD